MNMKLYYLLFLAIFLSACNEPINKTENHSTENHPNIVIILADDQGWGDLSLNGNPLVKTSNIDNLASQGVVLNNFYVNSVCSPTRAEFLTGRYHVRGGVYSTSEGGERLDLDENTIAEAFQRSGYETAAFGKWHSGTQPPYHPIARGFNEFYGYCSGHWGSYFDALLENNGNLVNSEGYLTDVITSKTIDFIVENKTKPFFAYLPLNTPHSPMQVPDKWMQKFKDVTLPKHRYSDKENIEKTKSAYAMAENIDWNVGRIIETLDSLHIADNTIIIYFSDNGPNGNRWNNNMRGQKGSTDEGGVRSPFIIKWGNKISGGKNINNIAHAIDLYPTLAALAGVKPANASPFDGINLSELLLGDKKELDDRILFSYWQEKLSLRNQQFRLDNDGQLFDMENDLSQENDVSESHPSILNQLMNEKRKWEMEVLSELPEIDDRRIPIAHPEYDITHLPARDAKATGGIIRSNRWPNCSFYTNWKNETDKINWECEALSTGMYKPVIFYTCKEVNVGVTINLSDKEKLLTSAIVKESFDPPLRGMEHDRIPRGESYVKDWRMLDLPPVQLTEGKVELSLSASNMQGPEVIDFRLMTLTRME